jgi:hypothetical protein
MARNGRTDAGVTTDAGVMALRSSTKPLPTDDKKELMKRLLEVRPFVGKKTKRARKGDFNPDTFVRLAKEHVENFSIAKFGEDDLQLLRRGGGPQTVVFNQVATFKDVTFFTHPRDLSVVFSVINDEMRKLVMERGYVEIHPVHYTDISSLPRTVASTNESVDSAWNERLAPSTLTVSEGQKYPTLWKKGKEETTAAAIVRAVEERLVDEDKQRVWSPYRLWTPEARKGKKDSKFTKYLQAYFYIRDIDSEKRPEEITLGLTAMATEAVAAQKEIGRTPDWYQITLEVFSKL